MGMGGSETQVVYYVPTTAQGGVGGSGGADGSDGSGGCSGGGCAQKVVTPAIAKSIAGDTARAQEAQMQERQRAYGISSTYNRYKNRGTQSEGNNTLGGS